MKRGEVIEKATWQEYGALEPAVKSNENTEVRDGLYGFQYHSGKGIYEEG